MSLQEFIDYEKEKLRKFEEFYAEGMRKTPAQFPSSIGISDWAEQLEMFE